MSKGKLASFPLGVLLLLCSASSPALAEEVTLDMSDGFALKKSCLAVDTKGRTLPKAAGEKVPLGIGCWAHVIMGYGLLTQTETCKVPKGDVDTFPLVDVVRRYLDAHPAELGMQPTELVIAALRPEFDCQKKS